MFTEETGLKSTIAHQFLQKDPSRLFYIGARGVTGLLPDCFERSQVSNNYSKEIIGAKMTWLT